MNAGLMPNTSPTCRSFITTPLHEVIAALPRQYSRYSAWFANRASSRSAATVWCSSEASSVAG
jgi:hypothetical protein